MREVERDINFKSLFLPFTSKKAVIFIVLIGLLIFSNGLFNNFVRDDVSQILSNPNIQSLNNIPYLFWGNRLISQGNILVGGTYFKPLLDTTFSLTYALFGANPLPFHFFQISLYIINACILFVLLKQFFKKSIAFILSIAFLLHPINSEVALYISATQEVLFLFFGLLSLLVLKGTKSLKGILLTSFLLFLSLLSKETGILFVLIALLYTVIYKRKFFYSLLGFTSLITSAYVILRIHAIGIFTSGANFPFGRLNLTTRLLNIPEIFLYYLKTFIFPFYSSTSYNWFYTKINFSHFLIPSDN